MKMNENVKKTGLFALSVLTLGTAVIPLLSNPEPVQATTLSDSEARQLTNNLRAQIFALKSASNLKILDYVKTKVQKDMLLLPSSTQVDLKKQLDESEETVLRQAIYEKYRFLRGTAVEDVELKEMKDTASRMKKTSRYYKETQQYLKEIIEYNALFHVFQELDLSKSYKLDAEQMKNLDKYLPLVSEKHKAEYIEKVKDYKERAKLFDVEYAVKAIELVPEKNLVAKVKNDAKALPSSANKNKLLGKIADVEKKQKAYTTQQIEDALYSNVASLIGKENLPSYIQAPIDSKLSKIKSNRPSNYLDVTRKYYGKKISNLIGKLENQPSANTPENMKRLESYVKDYEQKTGDTFFQSKLKERRLEEVKVRSKRLGFAGKAMTEIQIKETLDKSISTGSPLKPTILDTIDDIRVFEAERYVYYVNSLGYYNQKLPEYKKLALEAINKVGNQEKKDKLIQLFKY